MPIKPGVLVRVREQAKGRPLPSIDDVVVQLACSRNHARKVLARLRYERQARKQ